MPQNSKPTIIIDDCPHTYAAFNKIEINNSSSSVTFNGISFVSTASTANGVGHFEMVDNATVSQTGCLFLNMGTFRKALLGFIGYLVNPRSMNIYTSLQS